MGNFTGFDANQAIVSQLFAHAGALSVVLSEEARDGLRDAVAGTNALQTIITTIETLYAHRSAESFPSELIQLLLDLCVFVEDRDFHGYGSSGRARAIITVCERVLSGGEAVDSNDPA